MTTKNAKDMTFGERLMLARNTAQLSRPQLAEATGIPTKAIEKFEYGTQEPNLSRLQTLAKVLEVTDIYLMTGVNDISIPSNDNIDTSDEELDIAKLETEIKGDDMKQVSQKLAYLDELRDLGFQKHWRTVPRLFTEVDDMLINLALDDILDLAEIRGLYPIENEFYNDFEKLSELEQEAIIKHIALRIQDTACFGIDMFYLKLDDLIDIANKKDLDGDKEGFFVDGWSGYSPLVEALRREFWEDAIKGKNPDFIDESKYKKREVA